MKRITFFPFAFLFMLITSPTLAGDLIVRSQTDVPIFVSVNRHLANRQPRHEVRLRDLNQRFVDLEVSFPRRHMPALRADRVRVHPVHPTIVEVHQGRYGDLELVVVEQRPGGNPHAGYPLPPRPYDSPGYYDHPAQPYGMPMAMSPAEFSQLRRSLRQVSFENDRVALVRQALSHRFVSTGQVAGMLRLFTFERNKLEVAKMAYHRTVDPENYYLLHESFTFRSNARELQHYVESHPPAVAAPACAPEPRPQPRPQPHLPGRRQPRRAW
ncbi:MAG: DUF4476 domain-containing protein [Bacteroidetes bacterium]|nr:MAG: DUF4476 domain-containing protein [Bacteroidota bacterium]